LRSLGQAAIVPQRLVDVTLCLGVKQRPCRDGGGKLTPGSKPVASMGVGAPLRKLGWKRRGDALGLERQRLQIGMFDGMLAAADGTRQSLGMLREIDQRLGIEHDAGRYLALSRATPESEDAGHGSSQSRTIAVAATVCESDHSAPQHLC